MNDGDDWVSVRILRQDHPAEASYWQRFLTRREPGLNVTAVLQRIATEPRTATGEIVAPIGYGEAERRWQEVIRAGGSKPSAWQSAPWIG